MEADKTTLKDLSIFIADENESVLNKIDFAQTTNGKAQLQKNLATPLKDISAIKEVQDTIRIIQSKKDNWPKRISNGTIMVVERLFLTSIDQLPKKVSALDAFSYKIFHSADYSLVKYSAIHCFDLLKGMHEMVNIFLPGNCPAPLQKLLSEASGIVNEPQVGIIKNYEKMQQAPIRKQLQLAQYVRHRFKNQMLRLIQIYAQLDAWWAMGEAMQQYNLVFPHFVESNEPLLEIEGLYHLLLHSPTPYNVQLKRNNNFLFLTGANMAGKSTFIKAVGSAVFLAHVGMGVPATGMKLALFDGLLSNINVVDNIAKGESYFYNEVQRIKATINKVNDGRKWLILIDELFKGTNVQDAMKCSTAVIEGLLKIKNSLFILSTHLYEIGEALKKYPNIQFNYFETTAQNGQLHFSYHLKEGISNDRLGYLILQREGVVKMLEGL